MLSNIHELKLGAGIRKPLDKHVNGSIVLFIAGEEPSFGPGLSAHSVTSCQTLSAWSKLTFGKDFRWNEDPVWAAL